MSRPRKENWDERIHELVSVYEAEGLAVFLDPESFQDLIDYYESEEQFEKALSVARLATTHYRFSSDFYVRQVQLLLYTNRSDQAQEILEEALAITPGDFELSLLQAETYIRSGQTKEGLVSLAPFKLQASKEDLSEILLVESLAYERDSDFDHMFYALKAALQASPTNDRALERISLCMEICRKHEEGSTLFRWIIDESPYSQYAWFYLGQAQAYLNHSEEAIEAYEYAFLIDPTFEEAFLEFAELCYENGHFSKALDAYREMAERFGSDSDLLLCIGGCYHSLEKYETARHHLEQAARIDPHNDEIFFKIGECYAAQEKWAKAMSFFKKAIRMHDHCEEYHQALAECAFELDDYKQAEASYAEALEIAPENSQVWLDMAWFLLEMLRSREALDLLEEANETIEDPELQFSYVACLFANGRRKQALQLLSEALADNYAGFSWLFECQPGLRSDNEVNALISLYRPA